MTMMASLRLPNRSPITFAQCLPFQPRSRQERVNTGPLRIVVQMRRPYVFCMRRWLPLIALAAVFYAGVASAQRPDSLGPEVRKYLRVSTPRVILEHVQVFDGTGAAPMSDRNISIADGKITAVSPGADEQPHDSTTVLDLHGYSVMPGIVGMHNHLAYIAFPN